MSVFVVTQCATLGVRLHWGRRESASDVAIFVLHGERDGFFDDWAAEMCGE